MFSSRLVTKSRLTLCDLMDCSLPGSSVHGISQSRILEWVALSASRESPSPKGQTHSSCIGRQILYRRAVGKAQVFPYTVCLFEGDKSAWVVEKAGVLWCCCFLGFEAVDPSPRFLSGSVFKTGTWSFLSGKVKQSPVGHPKPSSFLRFLEIKFLLSVRLPFWFSEPKMYEEEEEEEKRRMRSIWKETPSLWLGFARTHCKSPQGIKRLLLRYSQCWLKKYSQPKNWGLCFTWWEFLGLQAWETASQITVIELLPGGELGRSQII